MLQFFKKLFYKNEHKLPKRMWLDEHLTEKDKKKYKDSFGQITGAEFIEIMDEKFTPYMKSLGFKGSKNNFYLHNKPWIYTVNIFKDKYGGSCALNLGIHLDFIEPWCNEMRIPSKFIEPLCLLRESLGMNNGNSWYYYGLTPEEGHETVDLMMEMFQSKAVPYMEQFKNYPEPFTQIKYEDLLKPSNKFLAFGINDQMLDWVYIHIFLAQVYFDIGEKDLALKILRYSLAHKENQNPFIQEQINRWIEKFTSN